MSTSSTVEKFNQLKLLLSELLPNGLIIAFSGGVDSCFLLWSAHQVLKEMPLKKSGKLIAFTASSDSMAAREVHDAKAFTEWLAVEHIWEKSSEVEYPEYKKNDQNRCYYCKKELFRIGGHILKEYNCAWLAYGYNASDEGDIRPGHQAAQENSVLSPLHQVGLTKNEIRALMQINNVPFFDKPASPCLSSRIMRGVEVTSEKLKNIDELEEILRLNGLKVFRVRLHEQESKNLLRIETDLSEIEKVLSCRDVFIEAAKSRGYQWVTLDLSGYKMGGASF